MRRRSYFLTLYLYLIPLSVSALTFAEWIAPQEYDRAKSFGWSLRRNAKPPSTLERRNSDRRIELDEEQAVHLLATLVVFDLLVVDRLGRAVSGLKKDDFVLTEDGRRQEVSTFSLGNNNTLPMSLVLIIDYSGSQLPYINASIDAAKELVERLGPDDQMAIVTDDVSLLVDFTTDKNRLKSILESLRDKVASRQLGLSCQFSALMATLKEMLNPERHRAVVIFQTDGDEVFRIQGRGEEIELPPHATPELKRVAKAEGQLRKSIKSFSLDDMLYEAEKSQVTIYSLIPGPRLLGLSVREQQDHFRQYVFSAGREAARYYPKAEVLLRRLEQDPGSLQTLSGLLQVLVKQQSAVAEVAKVTGGWFDFLEEPARATQFYSSILADINSRYVVGFYPTNTVLDGKRHKVHIEVRNHPEYVVWGRSSYFALPR